MAWIFAPRARMRFTWETSTVMPQSLNDPVCVCPHCLTYNAFNPNAAPSRGARSSWVHPSPSVRTSASSISGNTHSRLPHTPERSG